MPLAEAAAWSPGKWRGRAYSALSLLSPRRARLARHFARYEEDPVYRASWAPMFERGYRNARSTGQSTPFASGFWSRSADAEILHDLHWLRNRSRELSRDDPIASGVLRTWTEGVVGCGVNDRAALGDKARETAIDVAWRLLRDNLCPAEVPLSWSSFQRMLARRSLEDGEAWVVRSWPSDGGPVQFDFVEADRILTPLDSRQLMADVEGGQIREGIERDGKGRIRAYWVAHHHPGETAVQAVTVGVQQYVQPLSSEAFDRVEVADAWHLKHLALRPGQSRGVPILHAVIQDLRDLDLLILAVLKRVQISACFAAFIESPEDLLDIAQTTSTKYGYQLSQDIVPSMIFKLFPGEKVTTVKPDAQIGDTDILITLLARRIGASLGISQTLVMRDFSKANYSSARADDRAAENGYACARGDLIDCLSWVRETVLSDALMRGGTTMASAGITAEDLTRAKTMWTPTRRQRMDPEKEEKADALAKELGVSLRTIFDARGLDWEAELEQRILEEVREAELRTQHGAPAEGGTDVDADEGGELTLLQGGSETDLESVKMALDTYGIGVRAGVLSPTEGDEAHFRASLGLPEAGEDVAEVWAEEPVRRPVTLSPHTDSPLSDETPAPAVPAFGAPAPQATTSDEAEAA